MKATPDGAAVPPAHDLVGGVGQFPPKAGFPQPLTVVERSSRGEGAEAAAGVGPGGSLLPPSELSSEGALAPSVHNQRGFVGWDASERDAARRENRRRMWSAQRAQVSISRSLYGLGDPRAELLKRYGLCRRFPKGDLVTLRQRAGRCHFGNVVYCGSPWCMGCGSKIAEARALEYAAAALVVVRAGGLVAFSTWTIPHELNDSLSSGLAVLQDGISKTDQNSLIKRSREGILWHFLRRLDATWGPAHGYHPHRHEIRFLRPGTSAQQAQELDRLEFQTYANRIERETGRRPSEHGHDFQIVATERAANEVVRYLCKEALRELTYTHTKWGRGENRSAAQVLVDFYRDGGEQDREVWIEWALAMYGKRSIRPSVGLRRELLPGAPDLSDYEVAQHDDGLGLVLDVIDRVDWDRLWRSVGGPAMALDAAEAAIDETSFDREYFRRRLQAIASHELREGR